MVNTDGNIAKWSTVNILLDVSYADDLQLDMSDCLVGTFSDDEGNTSKTTMAVNGHHNIRLLPVTGCQLDPSNQNFCVRLCRNSV